MADESRSANDHDAENDRAGERAAALRDVQSALINEIDASIGKLERARISENTREHLEILRSLLKAQVTAYLEHFIARRATLIPHTSAMYAGDVGEPGVISTTFNGLLESGTLSSGQGAQLSRFLSERRTLVIFGDHATGKSTLLNSLFELVPIDERFVTVERGPDLPALKERSFCVRLTVDRDTDIPSLFAKARHMSPGRLVVGEIHADEVRELFSFLAADSRVGGMATLRAETVHQAMDSIVAAFGGDDAYAHELVAKARPAFVHMQSGDTGLPRLAAIWTLEGTDGRFALKEVATGPPASSNLVAET